MAWEKILELERIAGVGSGCWSLERLPGLEKSVRLGKGC